VVGYVDLPLALPGPCFSPLPSFPPSALAPRWLSEGDIGADIARHGLASLWVVVVFALRVFIRIRAARTDDSRDARAGVSRA